MFRPMAITVCSAILGSLLLSLTVGPGRRRRSCCKATMHAARRALVRRLRERYSAPPRLARWTTAARRSASRVAVVAVALGSLPFLGTEFMPRLDEGSILIETRKLPSVSLTESVDDLARASSGSSGRSPRSGRSSPRSAGRTWPPRRWASTRATSTSLLHPREEWTSGRDEGRADRRDGRRARRPCPGVTFNFTQPMAMRLDEVVSGVKADVAVKIFGQDAATLERLGERGRGASSARCRAPPTCRSRSLSGAAQLEIDVDRGADGALRPERRRRARGGRDGRRRVGRDRACSTGRGASPSSCGCPTSCARRRRGDRVDPADRARRRAGAARAGGAHRR